MGGGGSWGKAGQSEPGKSIRWVGAKYPSWKQEWEAGGKGRALFHLLVAPHPTVKTRGSGEV